MSSKIMSFADLVLFLLMVFMSAILFGCGSPSAPTPPASCMTEEEVSTFTSAQVQQLTPECKGLAESFGLRFILQSFARSATCPHQDPNGQDCTLNVQFDVIYSCGRLPDICTLDEAKKSMDALNENGQTSANKDLCVPKICANSKDMETILGISLTMATQEACTQAEKSLQQLGKVELSFVDESDLSMSCVLAGGGEIKGSKKGFGHPLLSHSSRREGSLPLAATIAFFVFLSA